MLLGLSKKSKPKDSIAKTKDKERSNAVFTRLEKDPFVSDEDKPNLNTLKSKQDDLDSLNGPHISVSKHDLKEPLETLKTDDFDDFDDFDDDTEYNSLFPEPDFMDTPKIEKTVIKKEPKEDILVSPIKTHDDKLITVSQPSTPAPVQSDPPETTDWMEINDNLGAVTLQESSNMYAPRERLKPEDVLEDDGKLRIFWTDYSDFGANLGLFGKVLNKKTGKYSSVFLGVKNISRELYFLPRKNMLNTEASENEQESGKLVGIQDVYEEVYEIMAKYGILDFRSKPVKRKYCFELPDVPQETEYLQVLYNYSNNANQILPSDLSGRTFSRVFGTHTDLFEHFVLTRNIMGPCWLEIESPDFNSINNASWCDLEVGVDSPLHVSVLPDTISLPTPPMNFMSLSIRTIMNRKDNRQEIAAISGRIYSEIEHDTTTPPEKIPSILFSFIRPIHGVFPMGFERELAKHEEHSTIKTFKDESSMLEEFLKQVSKFDPDVYIGHALENVVFNIISHRIHIKKVRGWSVLGRRKFNAWPRGFGRGNDLHAQNMVATGRLLLDISNTYGQSLTNKCDSWTLTEMVKLYLNGKNRLDQPIDASKSNWAVTASGLYQFIVHNEMDTYFSVAIALKTQMLALSKQLTNLAGNSWARTLMGTRSERNEFILLHEFHRQNYITPDKQSFFSKKKHNTGHNIKNDNKTDSDNRNEPLSKKKDKYKGGLVFEPEKGLYDKIILVMDFNSLYPSIIQEFNICFTTVDRHDYNLKQSERLKTLENGENTEPSEDIEEQVLEVPDRNLDMGIFPKLVQTLVKRRRLVKAHMKDPKATPTQLAQYDIKQQALKLTANSMYGCLGFTKSRFYARPLAVMTTFKGREILMATKALAESIGLQVIYGDTDSVMINTNVETYEEAIKIGNDFKRQVNQRYRLLEIDIDNIFRRMLLHSKKKYAAVIMKGPEDDKPDPTKPLNIEVKGLDMKRREYCQLTKEASKYALDQILGVDSAETSIENIHDYLRNIANKVRNNEIALGKFVIRNRLGKNPKDYPGGSNLPHVVVAQRLIDNGDVVKPDDVISYIVVIINDETSDEKKSEEELFNKRHVAQRALTLKEIEDAQGKYVPDPEYYLSKQILPPLERLVAPVQGTDSVRLAECLGLDVAKYQARLDHANSNGSNSAFNAFKPFQSTIDDSERFRNSKNLLLQCNSCQHVFAFLGLTQQQNGVFGMTSEGVICPECQEVFEMTTVNAQLESQIRSEISLYYAGYVVCEECNTRSRALGVYGQRCIQMIESTGNGASSGTSFQQCGGLVSFEYSDLDVYNQMLYYESLFDVDTAMKKAEQKYEKLANAAKRSGGDSGEADTEDNKKINELVFKARDQYLKTKALAERNRLRFSVPKQVIEKYMSQCGRRYVDMKDIFSFMA